MSEIYGIVMGNIQMLSKMIRSRWTLPLAAFVLGLGVILFWWLALRPHSFAGTLLQEPKPAYDFTLTGPDGTAVRLSDLRGKLVLVFFGYASCPDVCPATLHNLKQALNDLGTRASQVQVVFISVDPERDTPARLKSYMNNIDSRMLGLTGDLSAITNVASQYGIFFQKQVPTSPGVYEVQHTAIVQLIDQKGFLRVVYDFQTPPGSIASDARYLLTH